MLKQLYFYLVCLPLVFALTACGGRNAESITNVLGSQIDQFMQPYLAANGITAATLTVMKNGVVLYERAYGYKDSNHTITLENDALMSGASIVKPLTAAGIQLLAAQGTLNTEDKVFCSTGITPSATNHCWISNDWVTSPDTRIFDITISHLLSHKGGWNRAGTGCYAYQANPAYRAALSTGGNPCDLIKHEFLVQSALSLSTALPTLQDDIKYFMRANLDYTPGTTFTAGDRYSNFGYMLLGYIIEQASGLEYNTFIATNILNQFGVTSTDFKTGGSRLADADFREPNYITSMTGLSIYSPGNIVPIRDGILVSNNFKAAATSIMTSKSMAKFANYYKIDAADGIDGANNGTLLGGVFNNGYHYGDLPGTAAVVRQFTSGVSYAVLMNKNDKYEGSGTRINYPQDVRVGIDAAISSAGF